MVFTILQEGTNAYISVTVKKQKTWVPIPCFIGEITDMEVLVIFLRNLKYYQNHIKLKPPGSRKNEAGQNIWRCRICGYEYIGDELPEDFVTCPLCKHPASVLRENYEAGEKKM